MFKVDVCFDWLAARQSLEAAPILPQTQGWGAVIGPNRSNLNQTGKWAVKSAPVHCVVGASPKRSQVVKFGARWRQRLLINS